MSLVPPQEYRKVEYVNRRGLLADRPAPNDVLPGTLYYSTDAGRLDRSSGAAWEVYATVSSSTVFAHAPTHQYGGGDPIINLSSELVIHGNASVLNFNDINAPLDAKRWRFVNYNNGEFRLESKNDDNSHLATPFVVHRAGGMNIYGPFYTDGTATVGGATTIGGSLGVTGATTLSGVLTVNGNANFNRRVTIDGDPGGNSYSQFEIKSSGHPAVVLNNVNQPIDSKKARVLYTNQKLQFDFVDDYEGYVVGGIMTFDRATGNLVLSGTTGGLQTRGPISIGRSLSALTAGSNPSLYLYDLSRPANERMWRIMNQDTQLKFYTQDDGETGHVVRMYLERDGRLIVPNMISAGQIYMTGPIYANTIETTGVITSQSTVLAGTIRGNSNEAAIFESYQGFCRTHWRDHSRPDGQRNYCALNFTGNLYICPTSDDQGQSPVGGDWSRSLQINRNGSVITGAGGLYVTSIIQGAPGLDWGWYAPTVTNQYGNNTWTAYWAAYHRVGNVVHVSGKIDVGGGAVGTLVFVSLSLPIASNVAAHGGHYAGGTMCGNNRTSGAVSFSATGADIYWISETTSNYGYYYTYSYAIV